MCLDLGEGKATVVVEKNKGREIRGSKDKVKKF